MPGPQGLGASPGFRNDPPVCPGSKPLPTATTLLPQDAAAASEAVASLRCRQKATPARPEAGRFSRFKRGITPAVGPFLPLRDSPARASLRTPGALPRRDPGVKRGPVAWAEHPAPGVDLVIRAGHDRIEGEAPRQEGLLGRAPSLRGRVPQACGSERWHGSRPPLGMVRRSEGRRCRGALSPAAAGRRPWSGRAMAAIPPCGACHRGLW
jgi:hypothetical protein